MARTQVEYLINNNGVEAGTRKNLQPYVANKLAKRGIVKIIGVAKRAGNAKTSDRLIDAINATITKVDLVSNGRAVITAGLPIYNNNDIAFLQIESLCAQKDAPAWELIICEEKSDKYFGIEGLEKYKARLKKAGCVRITFLDVSAWVPLGQKWIAIRDHMSPTSLGMMLCACDNYSAKDRINKTHEAFAAGYDWRQNNEGDFYLIKGHKAGTMTVHKGAPGLFMAVSKAALDRVVTKVFPKSGVDTWLMQNSNPDKIKFDKRTTGIHTDGYNTISHHRKFLYCRDKGHHMFDLADADKVILRIPKNVRDIMAKKLPEFNG